MGFGPAVTEIFFASLSSSRLCQPAQREESSEILSWVGTELPRELRISFCCSSGAGESAAVESKRGWVSLGWRSFAVPQKVGKCTQGAQTKNRQNLPGGVGGKGPNVGQGELGAGRDGAVPSEWSTGRGICPHLGAEGAFQAEIPDPART